MERTLVLVKPDGVQRGLVGEIIGRLERRGLKLVGMKMLHLNRQLAEEQYAVHRGKPFYQGLVEYITLSPVVACVVEGPEAVKVVRTMLGGTRPSEAPPGSIRGDLGLTLLRNLIHASDGLDTAQQEITLYFRPAELFGYQREGDVWIVKE